MFPKLNPGFRKFLNYKPPILNAFGFTVAEYTGIGIVSIGVWNMVGFTTICSGPSMMPTINLQRDLVLVDIFSGKFLKRPYQRGDIVIAESPSDPDKLICKRIRAVEDDRILITYPNSKYTEEIMIPPNKIWLAGDNPHNSTDSRHYGVLPISSIHGRAVLRFSIFNAPYIEWLTSTTPKVEEESVVLSRVPHKHQIMLQVGKDMERRQNEHTQNETEHLANIYFIGEHLINTTTDDTNLMQNENEVKHTTSRRLFKKYSGNSENSYSTESTNSSSQLLSTVGASCQSNQVSEHEIVAAYTKQKDNNTC